MKTGEKVSFCVNTTFGGWREVEGYIVDVAPHLPATFAVHRCAWATNRWKVSDIETGSCVGSYTYGTRGMAIFKAEIRLRTITDKQLRKAWADQPDFVRE